MKALVIYDSVYGNTGKVAHTIGEALASVLGSLGQAETLPLGKVTSDQIQGIDLLVIGSPTHRFRPTGALSNLLKSIRRNQLSGVSVAAFDTRLCLESIDSSGLRFVVDKGGYAASKIAKSMQKKGGNLVTSPEGFLVTGEEGPLKDGELERAANWANGIGRKCKENFYV